MRRIPFNFSMMKRRRLKLKMTSTSNSQLLARKKKLKKLDSPVKILKSITERNRRCTCICKLLRSQLRAVTLSSSKNWTRSSHRQARCRTSRRPTSDSPGLRRARLTSLLARPTTSASQNSRKRRIKPSTRAMKRRKAATPRSSTT